MKIPHPIPYQGSKRNLADKILSYFPDESYNLIEPFAGSSAITIAAATHNKCKSFHINDINEPLMRLWQIIINNPDEISRKYEKIWLQQEGNEKNYYDEIREKFNRYKNPEFLLYLLARCVKASVRYNSNGEFNQSPDNRRKGKSPKLMSEDIYMVSRLLKNKILITSKDYEEIFINATQDDIIYMDPPYQGVCGARDSRYYSTINFDKFVSSLDNLNKRNISYILSYDGRTGNKNYGSILPSDLSLYHIEIDAGRSTQSTLLGKNDCTIESLYLSKNLVERLKLTKSDYHIKENIPKIKQNKKQLSLFA